MHNAETPATPPPIESDVIPADSPYGQALLRRYDKETAEAEYRWKMGEIEGAFRNRQRDEAAKRRRDEMETDRFWFINDRLPLTTPAARTSLENIKKFDDAFLQGQLAKGHPLESLEREITALQVLHAENLAWWAEMEHREAKDQKAEQSKIDEADQRQADKFEKAVEAAVERVLKVILKDVAASGVFRGK